MKGTHGKYRGIVEKEGDRGKYRGTVGNEGEPLEIQGKRGKYRGSVGKAERGRKVGFALTQEEPHKNEAGGTPAFRPEGLLGTHRPPAGGRKDRLSLPPLLFQGVSPEEEEEASPAPPSPGPLRFCLRRPFTGPSQLATALSPSPPAALGAGGSTGAGGAGRLLRAPPPFGAVWKLLFPSGRFRALATLSVTPPLPPAGPIPRLRSHTHSTPPSIRASRLRKGGGERGGFSLLPPPPQPRSALLNEAASFGGGRWVSRVSWEWGFLGGCSQKGSSGEGGGGGAALGVEWGGKEW